MAAVKVAAVCSHFTSLRSFFFSQSLSQPLKILVKWQMPLCGVYPLVSKKSDVLDFTIGMIKTVIHFNGKSPSFCNMM